MESEGKVWKNNTTGPWIGSVELADGMTERDELKLKLAAAEAKLEKVILAHKLVSEVKTYGEKEQARFRLRMEIDDAAKGEG